MRISTLISFFSAVGLSILMLGCGSSTANAPKDIVQAMKAVTDGLKPNQLSKSMFSAAHPNGKPSEYVSFYFSSLGAAEWPASSMEFSEDEMQMTGMSFLPQSVSLVANTPDSGKGKQIVIGADDSKGIITLTGYVNPGQPAVLTKEVKLPKVKPAPGVTEMYRSNRQMGM